MKSYEFIDLAKKKEKITSYKLSRKTGISQSSLSQYKNENRVMDDYACFKIAEILCIDPKKIIARANKEREKDIEKKEFWTGKIKEYGGVTTFFLKWIFNIIIKGGLTLAGIYWVLSIANKKMMEKHSLINDSIDSVIFTVQNFEFTVISRVYELLATQQCILC